MTCDCLQVCVNHVDEAALNGRIILDHASYDWSAIACFVGLFRTLASVDEETWKLNG